MNIKTIALAVASLSASGAAWAQATVPPCQPGEVTNVGLSTLAFEPQFAPGQSAFLVDEKGEGVDLNGDLDLSDYVAHVAATPGGPVTNLGLATGATRTTHALSRDWVALAVREREQGFTDLNGDGDWLDYVLHLHRISSGVTTNLMLATSANGLSGINESCLEFHQGVLLFTVSEEGQGGQDLNGDGDALDLVAHAYDLAQGTLTNTGLPILSSSRECILTEGEHVVMTAFEAGYGDLNGDGDEFDFVPVVYDIGSNTVTSTGLAFTSASLCDTFLRLEGDTLAFPVREGSQGGQDLNGDGDAIDVVLHAVDLKGMVAHNTAHAMPQTQGTGCLWDFDDTLLVYLVDEFKQGNTDLNGDGDTFDDVAFLLDLSSGVLMPTGIAAWEPRSASGVASFFALENGQGVDLNGDGDLLDQVFHHYDPVGGLANLGLAVVSNTVLNGTYAAFLVREGSQGSDLNGDGDTLDDVLHQHWWELGVTRNHGLAAQAFGLVARGSLTALKVDEAAQGASDVNGDGDALDYVVHTLHGASDEVFCTGLAVNQFRFPVLGPGLVSFPVDEDAQGATDLNGDGDASDGVLHWFRWRNGRPGGRFAPGLRPERTQTQTQTL